jgi:hypothetical protein
MLMRPSGIPLSAVACTVAGNYTTGHIDAERLRSLQATLRAQGVTIIGEPAPARKPAELREAITAAVPDLSEIRTSCTCPWKKAAWWPRARARSRSSTSTP